MKLLLLCLIISSHVLQSSCEETTTAPKRKYSMGVVETKEDYESFLRSDLPTGIMNYPKQDIPEHFDARERWPECESIREIPRQKNCGFCWAVAASSALNDRLCIASNGTNKKRISAEDILTCCDFGPKTNKSANACDRGANILVAARYLWKTGAVTGATNSPSIGCKPASEETLEGTAPACSRECTNPEYKVPYEEDKTFVKGVRFGDEIEQIQLEILKHGPVTTSIHVIDEFQEGYRNGVYTGPNCTTNRTNHLVRLIGWGTEEGIPYWLIANSWGENWADYGGVFKIQRGVNLLLVETFVVALKTEYEPEEKYENEQDEFDRYNSLSVVNISSPLAIIALILNLLYSI